MDDLAFAEFSVTAIQAVFPVSAVRLVHTRGKHASCVLVRRTICPARDARLTSRVTALLGRFLPKLRAASQAAFFLSR